MAIGEIVWHDLTIPNADEVRDFYQNVLGWTSSEFDGDFVMSADGAAEGSVTGTTGVCFARGSNADLPPVWLIYIQVASVEVTCQRVRDEGGSVVTGPRLMGGRAFAVIKDPAGAVLAIIE